MEHLNPIFSLISFLVDQRLASLKDVNLGTLNTDKETLRMIEDEMKEKLVSDKCSNENLRTLYCLLGGSD